MALTLAACAPQRPAPAPAAPPPPAPASPAAPPPLAWDDAPLSAGDWTFSDQGGVASAAFGTPEAAFFQLRCEPNRQVSLIRPRALAGAALTIRTSYGERALPAAAQPAGLAATLAASDPLLDEIVFSRGRFAVESEGLPRLILPAWPEPARVIEDCRG